MSWTKAISMVCLTTLAGCGIPPVDPTLISDTPATAQSFAVAQQAARACYGPNALTKFRNAGFGVTPQQVEVRGGRIIERYLISPPDDSVSVIYQKYKCYVGLESMTPDQASQLAQIWVDAYDAKPNSAFGNGLSDHVSGAWRHFFTEPARIPDKAAYYHRIYIAAFKTWPHGPYDPQSHFPYSIEGIFPDTPGAAIRLSHAIECKPHIKTGPKSGAFLPCSGPAYRPR